MAQPGQRLGFIGTGTVGALLALGLAQKGYRVEALYNRHPLSAEHLARRLRNGARLCPGPQAVADASDVVFITTPDDAIAATGAAIKWHDGHWAVHCSGALSVEALEPVRQAGGAVGGFHPLQSFAGGEGGSLAGVTVALEGEGSLLSTLKQFASALGCRWIVVPPGEKPLYHLSGVLVSNYVVTLVKAAAELWEALGVPQKQAREALLTLLLGTLHNIEGLGIPQSLTGPIARGDVGTIARHLEELTRKAPALLDVYRGLGRLTVPIAQAKGTIDDEMAGRLYNLLGADSPLAGRG